MLYYLETNLICIVILIPFLRQLKQGTSAFSTDQRILRLIVLGTIVFCCSDMVAGILRGSDFALTKVALEASNLLYFEALVIISYLWYIYVNVRLGKSNPNNYRRLGMQAIPVMIFTIAALFNPLTHFLFTIDSSNLYERGPGTYLHWAITWTYFLLPTIRALGMYLKEKNHIRKREIKPLLYFAIAPAIGSLIQMMFYGVTSTQVGITVSIVLICLALQNSQVLTDALTGLNNRRGLDRYAEDCMQHNTNRDYLLIVIDINKFKNVNDKYGHLVGDFVLQSVAEALRDSCRILTQRLFICRFGGDEFIVFGVRENDQIALELKQTISQELYKNLQKNSLPEFISVSMGIAEGKCSNKNDFKELMSLADRQMYIEKEKSNRK